MLPEQYIIEQFYLHNYRATYNRLAKTYNAGCGLCREGKSLKSKKRCYYIPKNNNIFCHNCGWSSTPINWICKITNKSKREIYEEAGECYQKVEDIIRENTEIQSDIPSSSLPNDSINISDLSQLEYYKTNGILLKCLEFIKQRRIDTAINKPQSLYLSLSDKTHKNRLIIPFITERGKIEFYQTRSFLPQDQDYPKYLSKVGAEKTLYGIERITQDIPMVFLFEGPINSFFTKNGLAVAGITKKGHNFTRKQQHQYDTTLKWFDKIWVLDSQWIDETAREKSKILLEQGHKVFIWPKKFGKKYKDFNDICIDKQIDEIGRGFIKENTYEGIVGVNKLAAITR